MSLAPGLHLLPNVRSGKVRDMCDVGDEILMVTSDRISAFDVVFPTPIPGKGRVLTRLSAHWLRRLAPLGPNHLIAEPDAAWLRGVFSDPEPFLGRSLRVKKALPLPIECVVRGALEGSAWAEYERRGTIQEHALPAGLNLHDELPEPLFTPATKSEFGHDENITMERCASIVGTDVAALLRSRSLDLFRAARAILAPLGIRLADTKFEFGWRDGALLLIDEVLTPDSSRFLVQNAGGTWRSLDKQPLRDWAAASDWNREPPAPALPPEVVRATSERYREIARRILGEEVNP